MYGPPRAAQPAPAPHARRDALSCSKLGLIADDDDFAALARAWPRLRTFKLTPAYWAATRPAVNTGRGSDGDDELEDGYAYGHCTDDWDGDAPGPGDLDSDGEPIGIGIGDIPTPEVLRVFREHCPDLRELVLPYLDLRAGVPLLDSDVDFDLLNLPPHGLRRLAFGAQTPVVDEKEEGARAREMALGNLTQKVTLPLPLPMPAPGGGVLDSDSDVLSDASGKADSEE